MKIILIKEKILNIRYVNDIFPYSFKLLPFLKNFKNIEN